MKKLMNKIEHSIFILFLLVSAQLASAAEVVTYLHTDMLGSVVAATNSNGAVVYTEEYKPYGERIHRQDNGQDSSWYSGHSEDQDTRLTYMGARWYDPAIGRFLAIDPAGVNPEDIHTFNRYSYANNNPYKYIVHKYQ
jgi:RHS repeat-associated protein